MKRGGPLRADPAKTRAWQQRSRGSLQRGGRLNPVSEKRREAWAERAAVVVSDGPRVPVLPEDHAFRQWVSELVCAVGLNRCRNCDPAHRKTKRVNGDWLECKGGLEGNIMPLCRTHHDEQHRVGIETFASTHRLDLVELCRVVGEAYARGWTAFALTAAAQSRGSYPSIDLDDPRCDHTMEAP